MPLLMVDLDNTLLDRASGYRRWAESFVASRNGDEAEVAWLIEADGDGFASREEVAAQIAEHFGLDGVGQDAIVKELRLGLVEHLQLDPAVPASLTAARTQGWRIACVTNGTAEQQQRKIDALGLAEYLDAVVISEAAGVRKPDPMIFHLAAEATRLNFQGAWMVGDSASADIGGGVAVGVKTAWLHRGRAWATTAFAPTVSAESFASAIDQILSAER